jgi:hypothetical protein
MMEEITRGMKIFGLHSSLAPFVVLMVGKILLSRSSPYTIRRAGAARVTGRIQLVLFVDDDAVCLLHNHPAISPKKKRGDVPNPDIKRRVGGERGDECCVYF